jgi:hypothetical protein
VTVSAAPACKAMLAEATRLWPNRSTASDGILSSDAHKKQNPTSDHDTGDAVDLTHDPANGCDAHGLAELVKARRDARISYIISNRRIWTPAISRHWRPYTGTNPHEKHAHFSIHKTARNSTGLWFPSERTGPPPTPLANTVHPHPLEHEMTHDHTEQLDQNGNAQWFSGIPWERFRSLDACHPVRPHADGRYAPGLDAQPAEDEGKVLVVITGGPPGGQARVLLTVADA